MICEDCVAGDCPAMSHHVNFDPDAAPGERILVDCACACTRTRTRTTTRRKTT